MAPGAIETGRLVAALKALGFDYVYDTSFAADLTVIEEANEFLHRKRDNEAPAAVHLVLPGLGEVRRAVLPYAAAEPLQLPLSAADARGVGQGRAARTTLGVAAKDIVVVSIMPCTAKKYEAKLPKFKNDGRPDVDQVLTTQELARMIEEAGLKFDELEPQSLDMPLGFKTGAGVIFGATGGVTEAVLRYAAEKLRGVKLEAFEFPEVRGRDGVREVSVTVGDVTLKLAVVHGLKNARRLAEDVRDGKCHYDLIEVMACPGGCVGGAGQPVTRDIEAKARRATGLYHADKMLQLHKSQENHLVAECYDKHLGEVGGHEAHRLLHTGYQSRPPHCRRNA